MPDARAFELKIEPVISERLFFAMERKVQIKFCSESFACDPSILEDTSGWQLCGEMGAAKLIKAIQASFKQKNFNEKNLNQEIFLADGPCVTFKYRVVQTLFMKSRVGVVLSRTSSQYDFCHNCIGDSTASF